MRAFEGFGAVSVLGLRLKAFLRLGFEGLGCFVGEVWCLGGRYLEALVAE